MRLKRRVKSLIKNVLKNKWVRRLLEIARFGTGSLFVLISKLLIVFMINNVFGITLWLNYLIVQVIIVFISYGYHSKITFKKSMSGKGFIRFCKAVLITKLIDYVTFNYLIYSVEQHYILAVIVATAIIFIIRFLIIKKVAFKLKLFME